MIIRSLDDRLELECVEKVPDQFRLKVFVTSDSFSGQYDGVWIARSDYQGFMAALRRLEADRHGSAELKSMSPNEFRLRIWTIDRWGHVALEGWLGKFHYCERQTFWQQVWFAFEFDAEYLRKTVRDFELLT